MIRARGRHRADRPETEATARGTGMAAAGLALMAVGVGSASTALVLIGLATAGAAGIGFAWLALAGLAARRDAGVVRREILPSTLSVASEGQVTATLHARGAALTGASLREQAASELTGGAPTRAIVCRTASSIQLAYRLTPHRRGRWPLGPALIRVADPLGMAWTDRPVGGVAEVAVWPETVDLAGSAGELMGAAERAARGARVPAADDAALRDYRDGDDLRRIHWSSTARRGTPVVRSEEQAGRASATVLMLASHDEPTLEWSITAAASIALSVLESGHPVHLVAGGTSTTQDGQGRSLDAARAAVLDAMVDLGTSATDADAQDRLVADAARLHPGDTDIVVAVLEPLAEATMGMLAPLVHSAGAWALVRGGLGHGRDDCARTAEGLRSRGWTAIAVTPGESVGDAWVRLLAEGGPR